MSGYNTEVSSFGSLNAAIEAVDAASAPGTYTITIDGPITETSDPEAVSLASGISLVIEGTLGGGLDGGGSHRGLFVYQGDVTIENLTIEDAHAVGGAGTVGGGGGAGLGGGLFVAGPTQGASGGTVTLSGVTFSNDAATGGNGGGGLVPGDGFVAGGGGGLGGAGGASGSSGTGGGGGGIGSSATGGSPGSPAGNNGIVPGGGGGNATVSTSGGLGGAGGAGGGVGGSPAVDGSGGSGGFGGGGGGGDTNGGHGGFGGGGGGGVFTGGAGGFGGGGGGGYLGSSVGQAGFGGGTGAQGYDHTAGGGGGLGAGGDIFVQAGGSLIIEGGTLGAGYIAGGSGTQGGGGGGAFGSAIFLQGNQTLTLQSSIGQTLVAAGSIDDQFGSVPDTNTPGAGGIAIAGGTVDLTAASDYTGGTTIEDGTLILGAAGAAGSGGITFGTGDPPFLEFSLAAAPTNVISGFVSGDTIDVTDLTFASITSTVFDTGTDILTIDYATGGAGGELTLTFSGAYTAGEFGTVYDGASGTDIVVCYLRGTQILTPLGEAKVETLGIGDRVVTRFGGIQKIKWIGRQSYEAAGAPPHKIPVRIRAGALGENIPARDLYISPGHSMLLGDTLVLATALLNGITVTQEMPEDTPQIEFYQIELAGHDCVIAEGAWSETFADGPGLRAEFHNASEYHALYPDEPPPEALNLCAPRPESGAKLEAALRPVMARAAESVTPGRLEGYVERASAWKVEGWALDLENPALPVLLEICIQNRVIGTALARNHRADLAAAGKGAGCCAFTFSPPERLRPEILQTLRIRRAADGADLPLSSEILAMLPATTPPPRLRAVA